VGLYHGVPPVDHTGVLQRLWIGWIEYYPDRSDTKIVRVGVGRMIRTRAAGFEDQSVGGYLLYLTTPWLDILFYPVKRSSLARRRD
jgi:hypothetical protein